MLSSVGLGLQLVAIIVLIFDFFKSNPFSILPARPEDYWTHRIAKCMKRFYRGKFFRGNYYSEAFGDQEYRHARQVVLLACFIFVGIGLILQLIAIICN